MHKNFGERLRWLRESRDMTLREFAERIGCDPGYLSKLENGVSKKVSRPFIGRIALGLKVSPDWLLTGKGEPTWLPSGGEPALPAWSDKRLRQIFAVLDDLPEALGVDAFVGELLRNLSLKELQAEFHRVTGETYQTMPTPGRLFWNAVYSRLQLVKLDEESRRGNKLTDSATSGSVESMQGKWPALKKQLQAATEKTGKSALAKFLGVDLTRVSQWLTDAKSQREPGAEYALQMQDWLKRQT